MAPVTLTCFNILITILTGDGYWSLLWQFRECLLITFDFISAWELDWTVDWTIGHLKKKFQWNLYSNFYFLVSVETLQFKTWKIQVTNGIHIWNHRQNIHNDNEKNLWINVYKSCPNSDEIWWKVVQYWIWVQSNNKNAASLQLDLNFAHIRRLNLMK